MAFHDDRLPEIIESGAEYGPRFNTAIQTTTGGKERRVAYWSAPKYEGNIATGIQGQPGLDAGLAFFHARQGRLHTFPFKDWGDFTATLQAIATGDGTSASTSARPRVRAIARAAFTALSRFAKTRGARLCVRTR